MSHDTIQLSGTTEELIVRRVPENVREPWIRTLVEIRCLRERGEVEPARWERWKRAILSHPWWIIMASSFVSLVVGIFR